MARTKKATNAQIARAVEALGVQANPVMDAWVKPDGTIVLLLVPNAEPVEWNPVAAVSQPRKRTRKAAT